MKLIKKLYDSKKTIEKRQAGLMFDQDKPELLFGEEEMLTNVYHFLRYSRVFDTDLEFPGFVCNITEIFNRLGIGIKGDIVLSSMKTCPSRYNSTKDGSCTFNFSVDSKECKKGDLVEYYSSSELFPSSEPYSIYPGVKLTSGKESLYYSVGTTPQIRQYSIKLNKGFTLSREYSKDEVFFIFEGPLERFVIRIKKPNSNVVSDNYELDNELELLQYLSGLSMPFDVLEIYNKLCELCLGEDVSVYPEIVLCESNKTLSGWVDTNSISLKGGNLDSIIRTIGNKTITCYGNGNWNYKINEEDFTFMINSGKTLRYGIEAKDNKYMDDYTDSLLRYDVGVARREVEHTRGLVRERLKLNDNRKG